VTGPDGSIVFSADRRAKKLREFDIFIADWVPVLTRAALTAWRPGGRVKSPQQRVWPLRWSGVIFCGS
jgi:hypothetical protein